jgi:hypothetical protein
MDVNVKVITLHIIIIIIIIYFILLFFIFIYFIYLFFFFYIGCFFYNDGELNKKCLEKNDECRGFNGNEMGCISKDNGVSEGNYYLLLLTF